MIYIFTALYCEAHSLIKQFHLKKNSKNTRFQEFYHEESHIRLTVTGVGEIAAAAAVSCICTASPPAEGDFLVNIGTCARSVRETGIFLCSRIYEEASDRCFYPDMLIRHDFAEEAIVTGMRVWDRAGDGEKSVQISGRALYDMEAAALYQAGAYFFGPHQMIFLKIVSDFGSAVSRECVENLMEEYGDRLFPFIRRLQEMTESGRQEDTFPEHREELYETLCRDLHCSKAMRDSLKQHLHYLTLAGVDYISVIQHLYKEGLLPCKDKREGKRCFEELKRRVF